MSSSNFPPTKAPILVTGAHRTGTTWVGKMLAAGGEAAYISEPLNVLHRPGVLRVPVRHWYTYICAENETAYLPAMQETLRLRYHLGAELLSIRSRKDFLRMLRDAGRLWRGRLTGQRALLKDPFAVFSAPWFADRLGCQVVITLRHPAAFSSSLKRLNWSFDFQDLLDQPLLMRDWLGPYRDQMESMPRDDIVGQGALLWSMVYTVVGRYLTEYPHFQLVRHESLSLDPEGDFQTLHAALGLEFSEAARQAVLDSSSAENPTEVSQESVHAVHLDSRANLDNWKRRLTPAEIERVYTLTAAAAAEYYPEDSWIR